MVKIENRRDGGRSLCWRWRSVSSREHGGIGPREIGGTLAAREMHRDKYESRFCQYRHQGIGRVVCERVASPLQPRQSTWRDLEFGETTGSANPGFDGFQAGPELASAGGNGLGYEYGLIRCMEVDGAKVATDFFVSVRLPCESMP
jgi:hypothetical protein